MSFKMIFASAAALAMAAGTPALAAKGSGQQSAEAGSGHKAKSERKICRYVDGTESRMKRQRLCYTKEQWRKIEEAE